MPATPAKPAAPISFHHRTGGRIGPAASHRSLSIWDRVRRAIGTGVSAARVKRPHLPVAGDVVSGVSRV